jgi:serine/threonine-protein phosphatase 2B regulatory subunit
LPPGVSLVHASWMGANTSALLSEEIEEIARNSNLSQTEVKRLYKRFQKLDSNQSGTLEADELMMIPELAMNPLVPRIVSVFDGVNFREFVQHLGLFGPNGTPQAKIDFAFRVYDVDQDGFVSEDDLSAVLRMMVGDNIDDDMLHRVVQKVFKDADKDHDGRISREEFGTAIDRGTVINLFTIAL